MAHLISNSDVIGRNHALMMNTNAVKSLSALQKPCFGPTGSMKMLVSGGGQIKVTKDGKVLQDEMPIMHPTAAQIARQSAAQDEITGDGTTSSVLITSEQLLEAEQLIATHIHPRDIVDGYRLANKLAMEYLEQCKIPILPDDDTFILNIARTSLNTKVNLDLANHLADIVVKAIKTIRNPDTKDDLALDLHMIEVMHMRHGNVCDTRFVDGQVLDHGVRHPNMAKRSENVHIFVCNINLEYEKSLTTTTMMYHTPEERQKLVISERKFTNDKVQKIIELKERVVKSNESFLIINQGGIDPISLNLFQKAGILAIRRAKRRNMERLSKACGGYPVTVLDDLDESCLGFASQVYEHNIGDDIYTFIEGCGKHKSCTILINGPNDHSISQIKDALRDGLRAVYNILLDGCYLEGAGSFEISLHNYLTSYIEENPTLCNKMKLCIYTFAQSLLIIPKMLAENSGYSPRTTIFEIRDMCKIHKANFGLDITTGKAIVPSSIGIIDNYSVKKQSLHLSTLMATSLLLVDEVIRAGRKMAPNKE